MKKKAFLSLLLALTTTFGAGLFSACDKADDKQTEIVTPQTTRKIDTATLSANIDAAYQYDLSNNKVFGSAYYVYYNGKSLERCYGKTSNGAKTSVTNTSVFRLASMTKPVTAVAALILVERGLLSLDDTVDQYIPAFKDVKIIDDYGNSTTPEHLPTVRNLLTHTSGIGSNSKKLATMTSSHKQSLDSAIAFYISIGLDFEPNTKQKYSGEAAFSVLTKIIEIVSGTDYLSFLKKELFEPCDMPDTTFTPSEEQQKRMVRMHYQVNGESQNYPMPANCIYEDYPWTHYLGGAGLVSTLHDYCNFAMMLLNKGKFGENRILKEETLAQLSTPQVSTDIMNGNERWGLGVRVIAKDSYPYLPQGSFGWSGAYGTHFWVDPVNNIFAVYMKNSKYDGGSGNESAVNFEKAVYSSFVEQ